VFARVVRDLDWNRNVSDCVHRLRSLNLAAPHGKDQCSVRVLTSFSDNRRLA